MVFAALKKDFVFRRIFARHPDILRGPHRAALEIAKEATFTQPELNAYRRVGFLLPEIPGGLQEGDDPCH